MHSGWERIYIKDLGSFELPPTMEIQKGVYEEFVDELKKIKGYETSQLIAQQKGLNDLEKNAFGKKYGRVIMETILGSIGDFDKLNSNLSVYTKSDIDELNTFFKKIAKESFLNPNHKLIKWYPLKLEKVNGMSCIHISYLRQFNNKPQVLVHSYKFLNNDRVHTLTLSYRLSEENYWKSDYSNLLRSFRITNVR